MVRPDLTEAYARRLVAALSKELGSRVVSTRRTLFEDQNAQVVEWRASLENGFEIRLSATVLPKYAPDGAPADLSRTDLEELRDLGIAPGDHDGK
ncbi:MAG TPA: hypothetical protein VGX68_29080 [Thermoanaerobaculia bacterium]|jgi:hypothetical protein|nr:hypothetical protein [Thermoanaerobaculia bacterium]